MTPRQQKITIDTELYSTLKIQRGEDLFILQMSEVPFADELMTFHSFEHKGPDANSHLVFAEAQNFTQKFWTYFTDEEQQRMLPKLCQEALKGNKLARLLVHSGEKKT